MKVRPMLGEYQIEGIESIESAERRTLVEHRVPGMEGSYLQDLGSAPNAIVIAGTRHGDEARDAFLEQVRALFSTGEPTTFTADINTATDLTDVVIEDLQVAEVAGRPDSFRYVLRLRKYVEPPAPATAGLPGLDSDLLDQATSLVDALEALDALTSGVDLADPTPPLRGALDGVRTATADVAPAAADAQAGIGTVAERALAVPDAQEVSGSLAGVQGDAAEGTGVAGALDALDRADVPGQREALVGQLDEAVAGAVPAAGAGPGAAAGQELQTAAAGLPEQDTLAAPLADPLAQIQRFAGPEAAGAIPAAVAALTGIAAGGADPARLLAEPVAALRAFADSALGDSIGGVAEWHAAIEELAEALAAPTAELARDALMAFLTRYARELADQVLPGGGPAAALAAELRAPATADAAAEVRSAAEALRTALEALRGAGPPSAEQLAAAEQAMGRLATAAPALAAAAGAALARPAATPDGLAQALERAQSSLQGIEVDDLSDLPDALGDAFGELREAIAGLDAGAVAAPLEDTLRGLSDALAALDLERLGGGLDAARAEVEAALDRLDGALLEVLALVRAAFTGVRQALAGATGALGATGPDGQFHFHAEGEVQAVLERARAAIRDDLQPALDTFRQTVTGATGEVAGALQGVTAQLEAAKEQIRAALETATAELEAVDVTAVARQLTERLVAALDGLGAIDLDAVADPVVAQIESMRDQLRQIDPSTLNDVLRAALATASAALSAVDFPGEITAVLMTELDELLAVPVAAIADVQARLDAAVERFVQLDPQTLAAPLAGVFEPARAALDELSLDALSGPLVAWHAQARAALEEVMPERLLAPVVEAHAELAGIVASISPEGVAAALEEALAGATTALEQLDPAAVAAGLGGALDEVRAFVAALEPAVALAPVVEAHAAVAARLGELDPARLVEPLEHLDAALSGVLDSLTQADADRAATALQPLRDVAEAVDPERAYAAVTAAAQELGARLTGIELEGLLAAARAAQAETLAALSAAGDAAVARVEALDPLEEPRLTQALADLRRCREQLTALAGAAPPATLATGYAAVRPVAEALLPPWAQGTPAVEGLRDAFRWVDPAAVGAGVTGVHEEILAQWAELDPNRLLAPLQATHAQVLAALAAIDPAALAAQVQELVGGVGERLQALDLGVIRSDAGQLQGDVQQLVAGLDPRPTIERMSALADEVRGLVETLDPRALLADLEAPVRSAREILDAADPAAIAASLEPAFQRIRELLGTVDLAEALEPLTQRMDALRDELESALGRTERAFRELLAAIPG